MIIKLRPSAYVICGILLVMVAGGIWKVKTRQLPLTAVVATGEPKAAISKTPTFGSDSIAPPGPPEPPLVRQPVPNILPQPEALADMDNIQLMFRDFRTRVGGNPVGTNAEIMRGVMGANPFQARLGPPEGQSLNEHGELVDRWGTPYFFHQLSKDQMEIRSAGPDRRMWTTDDIAIK